MSSAYCKNSEGSVAKPLLYPVYTSQSPVLYGEKNQSSDQYIFSWHNYTVLLIFKTYEFDFPQLDGKVSRSYLNLVQQYDISTPLCHWNRNEDVSLGSNQAI